MFTGIIEERGRIASAERREDVLVCRIEAGRVIADLPRGGSIAVGGCCLTAVAVDPQGFVCELTEETLRRTAFGARLRPGALVNLERPMRASGRFDGHIVQGHVDAVGHVRALRWQGRSAELTVEPPADLERYLVFKGSVAVDGVSLTLASLAPGVFSVALIPYTLDETSLSDLQAGDPVNLEADVIAKYVERLLTERAKA
jgi:riboflavin synthase